MRELTADEVTRCQILLVAGTLLEQKNSVQVHRKCLIVHHFLRRYPPLPITFFEKMASMANQPGHIQASFLSLTIVCSYPENLSELHFVLGNVIKMVLISDSNILETHKEFGCEITRRLLTPIETLN